MGYFARPKCVRRKCPYYYSPTIRCDKCEWNKNSVWIARRDGEK